MTHLGAPLLLSLGLLSALAPFAMDLYLPAFPALAHDLGASSGSVQSTLSVFLLGAALGQLVFGPLSDRYGRRRPLLVGAICCLAAGIAAATAATMAMLLVARFLQGATGAAGMVIGRAVVSDLAVGPAAARAFSLMMVVTNVAPVVAPPLGGALAGVLGWRGLLGVVAGVSALMLVAVIAFVPESRAPGERTSDTGRHRAGSDFWRWLVVFVCTFAAFMGYVSASSSLYQTLLGFGSRAYGVLFGVNALALMAVSVVSAHLAPRVGPRRLARVGCGVLLAGALGLLLLGTSAGRWPVVALLAVLVASVGLVLGNATALALGAAPASQGRASALLGAGQFGLGALASQALSLLPGPSASATGAVLGVLALVALAATAVPARPPRSLR